MPKRDSRYMEQHREGIAKAALQVLLEKGVYATSLRDICARAGVSMGALYTHFRTKEDLIVAACAVDHSAREKLEPAADWAAYVAIACEDLEGLTNERSRRRFRLSLQFVAELAMMDSNPAGLGTIYLMYRDRLARSLAAFRASGEIMLPLGLDVTTEIHMQLIAGAGYQAAADRALDTAKIRFALEAALELTAGRAA